MPVPTSDNRILPFGLKWRLGVGIRLSKYWSIGTDHYRGTGVIHWWHHCWGNGSRCKAWENECTSQLCKQEDKKIPAHLILAKTLLENKAKLTL